MNLSSNRCRPAFALLCAAVGLCALNAALGCSGSGNYDRDHLFPAVVQVGPVGWPVGNGTGNPDGYGTIGSSNVTAQCADGSLSRDACADACAETGGVVIWVRTACADDTAPLATAKCNDGTYSASRNCSGTCSSHGGVKTWMNDLSGCGAQ